MAGMSDYLEGEIIKHIFRTGSFTKPSVLAFCLCTSAPVDSDTGALSGKEVPNSNGYARQTLNPSDSNWAAIVSGSGETSNLAAITFPLASGSWGTITHIAICDSATHGSGNLLFYGALASSKTVTTDEQLSIDVGNEVITLD